MGIQARGPEAAIESFNERIIRGFARPGEVQRHSVSVGPQIQVSADELGTLVNPDRLWIANLTAHLLQRLNDVLTAVAEPRIKRRAIP